MKEKASGYVSTRIDLVEKGKITDLGSSAVVDGKVQLGGSNIYYITPRITNDYVDLIFRGIKENYLLNVSMDVSEWKQFSKSLNAMIEEYERIK